MTDVRYDIKFPGIDITIITNEKRVFTKIEQAQKLLDMLKDSIRQNRSLEEFLPIADN